MKNFILFTAVLIALASTMQTPSAQMQAAEAVPGVAELSAGASKADQEAALKAMAEWLARDFDQARPTVVAWVQDPALPAEFRSRLLRSAIEAARTAARLTFATDAGPAYQELVDRLPTGPNRSQLHQSYGNLNLQRGQFEKAESLYRLALADGSNRDISERANVRSSLGVALAQQGRLDDALDQMLQAYRLFEQTEAGPSTDLLKNIGALSVYLEDWTQAVNFSRLAIEQSGPDNPGSTGIYSNLAAALIEQGKLEAALEALERGMAIGAAHGQPSASVISNLGYVLRELGRPKDALEQFERAAELNRVESDAGSLGISLKNIGETLIALDRRQAADVALQKSMAAYREADIKPKRLELYPVLVENLEQLEQFPEALAMMREYRELTEELASADAQARVAELQTAFDLERKERELLESERARLAGEAEVAALQAEQSRERLVNAFLLAGVIMLGLFLALMVRALRLRTQANQLLAEKNAEIDKQHKALGKTNALLHRQSVEDELTGLGNRRSLRQLLGSKTPTALGQSPALLVLVDIDRFKGVNDQFGHAAGDRVLAQFAGALRAVAGPDDVLVRWGGEEFVWLVAKAGISDAPDRCRALADQVGAADFKVFDRHLAITCSMGFSTFDPGVENPQTEFDLALKIADAALYEIKGRGRNGWTGFERRADDPKVFEGSLDIGALIKRDALARKQIQAPTTDPAGHSDAATAGPVNTAG
ncbi:MAG: diguanylate cyclase [Wenzhouxiangellaceae bacterium]